MKTGYKVSDAMTQQPIFVDPEATILNCAQLMRSNDVGSLLVKKGDKVIGICTEDDIIKKVIAEAKDTEAVRIKEIIDTNVKTIEPDKDIFDALMRMRDFDIKRLPVVKDGRFVGLLTLKDILKIEPQLFDMLVESIELREEKSKPIKNPSPDEGICQICGSYAAELEKNDDGVLTCENCKEN